MLEVHILRALKDNYIFVLRDPIKNFVAVVDPSEGEPVERFLESKKWRLDLILNTHHHHDHVGGNLALRDHHQCPIYCSAYDFYRIPGATLGLNNGETIEVGATLFKVLEVPGHTLGAIAYYSPQDQLVFTGDTLFTMGCGRLFEGSATQMWQSLTRLANLPPSTRVYSGHEYGLQNASFALTLAPGSDDLKIFIQSIRQGATQGRGTVPSTIGHEKALNPFLTARDAAEFAHLRRLKDQFRLEDDPSLG